MKFPKLLYPSFLCLLMAGCDMIDYHPYDVHISGETDVNAHNIAQIEQNCQNKTTIRFVTMGDSQRWYDETADFVSHLNKRDDIDFVIHGGDVSDFGVTDEFLWQRDIMNKLKIPYVVLLGNHDCLGTGEETYRAIFGNPNFSFIAGRVKFVCLNTNAIEFDYSRPIPETRENRYDRRVHRYRRHWEALIPTHTKIQFAGNMGLLSFGTGWDYGKRNQWETDVFFGVLPKYDSKRTKLTFTVKQNYLPWSLQIKQSRFSVEPLACGMYLNTVFGDEFWVNEPERYPKGYYGFSSKVRTHVFLGQRITYDIDPQRRFTAKEITFFYEISTCDLYVVSAFTNKYLKPKDYLSLSFGIKLQLL